MTAWSRLELSQAEGARSDAVCTRLPPSGRSKSLAEVSDSPSGLAWLYLALLTIRDVQSIYTLIYANMSQIASSMALQRQLARSGPQFAKTSLPRVQSRSLQDIAITRTGKPIIRISGGRYDSPNQDARNFLADSVCE